MPELNNEFRIIAHRGAIEHEPENTILSFQKAIDLGAKLVEFDVRLSLDNELVIMHDKTVDRTTNGTGVVGEMTLQQLKELNAGKGQKIPTFEEVLDFMKGKVKPVIELKEADTVEPVLNLLNKYKLMDEAFIVSFKKSILKEIRSFDKNIKTCLIKILPINIVRDSKECGANAVAINNYLANRFFINTAHRNGLFIFAWTENNSDRCKRLARIGLDGVVTNKPDLLLS